MKKRSGRLSQLLKLAAADERRMAEATGASQRRLNEEKSRLGELNAYRHEYARRSREQTYSSAAQLKDFQEFMHKLDKAVHSQLAIINECERNLDVHRRRWQLKRQRVESLEKVRDRYSAEELARIEKDMQRETDDRSNNRREQFPDA